MEDFEKALVCNHKNDRIPEEYNFFGKLVGAWDLEWNDHLCDAKARRVKGEWIFSWVLEGMAIQDVFIVPSRTERLMDIQPDASYGTTIRIFNPTTLAWDVFWGEPGESVRLEACRVGDEIVLTEITRQSLKWIFSDITDTSFVWKRVRKQEDGNWRLEAKALGTRKTE
ncbi:hypothetical protein [Bacteroides oleiciplenus]|uniref:DUF1579 domain-containing protein n=2 Tax=Bacteroides oleiciplenus TaxID=626931 RepID=K9DUN3_9BACE|nr:hypothetical protein [Bacteroides oleiciplenus]EKU88183.1 hypothetical protein HMPREF9447_04929 [Bacteroides oleiciplenus YIT 12058]RGN33280.1 hypothetical protein DXB65_16240 [Bacteroides oleiciplenus]